MSDTFELTGVELASLVTSGRKLNSRANASWETISAELRPNEILLWRNNNKSPTGQLISSEQELDAVQRVCGSVFGREFLADHASLYAVPIK